MDDSDRELWQSLVAHAPTLVAVFGADGALQSSNRPLTPDQQHDMSARVSEIRTQRVAVQYEGEGLRSDGTLGWYAGHYIPILRGDTLTRVLVVANDVTEERRAYETLDRNETRFRALVENGVDCMILTDADGATPYASPAIARTLGYEVEEMLAMRAIDLVHPDDRERALLARSSPPGIPIEGALRLRHKDGSWRWLEGSATNLLHDPSVRAIVSNRRDVTERRAAEEQTRFHASVLSQMNEVVIATDLRSRITYWNDSAVKLYGYTPEEAIGHDGSVLLEGDWLDPADREGHRDALRTVGSWRGLMLHTTKGRERIVVETSIRILRDAQGNPIAGISVLQDVTAKRRLEEQLRHAQKMEAIGVFAGGVAHDFNTLLSVILGCTEVTLRNLPNEHPDAQNLREAIAAAKRCAELTRKLVAFSRKQIMQMIPLDLNVTVQDAATLLARIVGEDVKVKVRCDDAPLVIRGDAAQLEQILFNLATNARQAMSVGGTLAITARHVVIDQAVVERNPWARIGRFAELAVGDSGVGMNAATLERIFEPFFTTRADGTGFGLATVYGIVQQHDGFVHVESAVGHGTTFRMFFPLHEDVDAKETLARGGSETILVAEDSSQVRSLLTITLRNLGYDVIAVDDGEQAVRELQRRASDVALAVLDVVMPKVDGLEAYARMRRVRPDLKALFVTGYAPDAMELGALAGEVRILEKPFSTRSLGIAVRTLLDA